jgi:hypothetical protein
MGIHPADSAGWRLKQCSILPVAARHWLVSDTTSLGSLGRLGSAFIPRFPTDFSPQFWHLSNRAISFSIPCSYQLVSCVTAGVIPQYLQLQMHVILASLG